eukprot:GHRR01014176.1.p1 GENE.GHRR01014176.1~~GHRR01014176.1.p1  ORF type:complete len:125 (+),score=27.81 GHRR01014176.1:165-539(+)
MLPAVHRVASCLGSSFRCSGIRFLDAARQASVGTKHLARSFAASAMPAYQPESSGHIQPHGGSLIDLMVRDNDFKRGLIDSCQHQQECSDRNACDVELLTVGGFSPLEGFLNKDAYDHVVQHMR